jgi:murein DD-endopeptidase MepM/ murein hydrolase activator NlpD
MDSLFSRRFLWLSGCLTVAGAAILGMVFHQRLLASRAYADEVRLAAENAEDMRQRVVVFEDLKVRPGLTFSDALQRMEVEPAAAGEVIRAASGVFDLRQIRAGSEIEIGRSPEGALQEVRYRIDNDRMLSVRPAATGFAAQVKEIPSRTETIVVRGEITDSLFGAIDDAGEGPELALRMAEIFGWDLDFYSDPRVGDTFRVEAEKKISLDGKSRSYGRVLYAEYVNEGHPYRALLFHDNEGHPAYFSPDGKSVEKAFLRSPLKFSAAITSGFSRNRFHPILHQNRAHLGTDYGAPIGTPVQAIGAGRVVFAGYKGANGNMVRLRHSNGYESLYLHLSRILVHAGDRVESGDRIGLVGKTGLATGPHLHFSILDHGVYKNFEVLRRNLPSAEPVPPADLAEFTAVREQVMAELDDSGAATTVRAASGSDDPVTPPLRPASLR